MNKRTTITFTSDVDVREAAREWAETAGFRLQSDTGKLVFASGGMTMEVRGGASGSETTIEAWIRFGILQRLCAGFFVPAEMGIESGGFVARFARSFFRKRVNKLLVKLGQPEIR